MCCLARCGKGASLRAYGPVSYTHLVDENLIRVHDLLAQLGERLGPLEKEAERARKYLELYEQKKATDVALWLYDMRVARAKLVELERGRAAAQAALDEADAALAKLDEQSDSLYVESQKKRSDAERASTRIAEYTEQLHSCLLYTSRCV